MISIFRVPLLIPLILVLSFLSFSITAAETKTITLDVPGMTCNICPITIRKALKKVPGVIDAKSQFEAKTATVTFDPTITNVETLIQTTAEAGYPSTLKK